MSQITFTIHVLQFHDQIQHLFLLISQILEFALQNNLFFDRVASSLVVGRW